ncbi:MAG TPA: hypothetical protein VN578_11190 [Candidatus Binatia bacterium]|jgi:hypothetical protein|nr:hypothetical protein [Candidatus Binatia bacterium]
MPAWERERGELPSPIWPLLDRKVGRGLFVLGDRGQKTPNSKRQAPEKLQSFKAARIEASFFKLSWNLDFGIWCFFLEPGGWNLDFFPLALSTCLATFSRLNGQQL